MINANGKAIIAKLIGMWPDIVPLTRSFLVCCLFIIDKELVPNTLNTTWKTKDTYYPISLDIIECLDEIGCLRPLKGTYVNSSVFRNNVNEQLTAEQIKAIDTLLQEMNSYTELADTFKLKTRMTRLMALCNKE